MGWNKKLSCNAVSMMASIQSHRSPESTSHYCSLPQEWGIALSTSLSPRKGILGEPWWLRVSDANIFILVGVRTSVLKHCPLHQVYAENLSVASDTTQNQVHSSLKDYDNPFMFWLLYLNNNNNTIIILYLNNLNNINLWVLLSNNTVFIIIMNKVSFIWL